MDELPFSELAGDDEPQDDAPTSRAGARRQRQEKVRQARRKKRSRFIALAIVLVVLGVGAGGYFIVLPRVENLFAGPADYTGEGVEDVEISIVRGDTGRSMADKLLSAGVVASTKAFVIAFDENKNSSSIQPGIYRLKTEIPAAKAVEMLLDPASVVTKGLTVADGLTVAEIITNAEAKAGIPREEFDAVIADPALIGLPEEAQGSVEGWLAPAVFPIDAKPTAVGLMSAMVKKRVEELTALGIPREQWRTAIIKASIAEKEVITPEDMAKVSQTIDNRLAADVALGSDAIIDYGAVLTGETAEAVRKNPDHPYSSRTVKGYPPTAINNPSLATITAILTPAPGEWMYWCTINLETGETRFALTLAEHNENRLLLEKYLEERGLE